MSTPDPSERRRVRIEVSPLSVPQSATTSRRLSELMSSDENSEASKGNRRTSLASLPGKRLLQPSQLENIDELPLVGVEALSKKACLRVDPVDNEETTELRNEIGRLQEKIAWMTSKGGAGVDSGLRLADMQEELRQEREHAARLKVKNERLERRVEDSERLQAELRAAREETKAYRDQVMALEIKVVAEDDHDRTLAALTKINQELDQRATEAATETDAVRKMYEDKVATLKSEMEDLRVASEEVKKKLKADVEEKMAEAKGLAELMEEKEKAHEGEMEGIKKAMEEQRVKFEGEMKELTGEVDKLREQSVILKDSMDVMEKEHCKALEDLKDELEGTEEQLMRARETVGSKQADLAEIEGRMKKVEAMMEEKTADLEKAKKEAAALREEVTKMEAREEQMDGRKRRRMSEESVSSTPTTVARVDQCTATEGAEWALLVNASSNTIASGEEEPALLEDAQTQQEELREEVKRLTEAIGVYKGRLVKAREEGDRLVALLVEGEEKAELFMRQRDAERRGMQSMIDELEEEVKRYRDGLAERETIEVEALAEAILGRATETAMAMTVAREMGKASEGLRMGMEELRVRLGEEQRCRRCAEETNQGLLAAAARVEEQLREVEKECGDLKAALTVSEESRENMAMVNAEEAEALNRLDEVVRKLEDDKRLTEAHWGEEKNALQEQIRELRARETELVEKADRIEKALDVTKERLGAEIKEAEEAAAATAECHQGEREAYERQLRDLVEQMATLEASAAAIGEELRRDVENARLEGNEAQQCLVNQREAYEKIITELEERLHAAEEAFRDAEEGYAKSKADVDAEVEERKREVSEVMTVKEEAIRSLQEKLEVSSSATDKVVKEVKELQERLTEEKERYAELVHTHERHIEALERQMDQAKAGYEKHIEEVNNEMHEMQTDHEIEIARVGREAIIEHDELVESFNGRMDELRREIEEKEAKIGLLESDSSALMESLKEAARNEATRITEEYEMKLEALEIDLTNTRYELAKEHEEGDHRLREITTEFEKLIAEKEDEIEKRLRQIQEVEKVKEAERAKKAEQVRAEMQSTIARLFEEKKELTEMMNNAKIEHERELEEEASKATSDRAQLVVSHTALVADIKAQAKVSLDEAEQRAKNALARAQKAEAKLDERMGEIGQSQAKAAGRIEDLKAAVEDLTTQKTALEKQATSLRAELARVKSSIGDAVRGAERGWEVAIRNLVDLPERYKATYDDFLQAKVRIEELTKELAEGHKSQNQLEERIKRLQSGKLSSSDEKTEATARQLRYEIRQLKDQYADLATRNIDFKRMAAEARCEAIQSAKLIVTYKREKDAAILEKEEALAGLRKSKPSTIASPKLPAASPKLASIPGKASTTTQQRSTYLTKQRASPSMMPAKSSLKKTTLGGTSSPSTTTKEATKEGLIKERQPPKQGNPRPPSPAPTKVNKGAQFLKLASPDDAKIEKKSPAPKRKEPPPSKKRVSMSPEECKQQ